MPPQWSLACTAGSAWCAGCKQQMSQMVVKENAALQEWRTACAAISSSSRGFCCILHVECGRWVHFVWHTADQQAPEVDHVPGRLHEIRIVRVLRVIACQSQVLDVAQRRLVWVRHLCVQHVSFSGSRYHQEATVRHEVRQLQVLMWFMWTLQPRVWG